MQIPHGATQDVDFMFTKLVVRDLQRADNFYKAAFGLVEMHRLDAQIMGRPVSEIVYQPTYQGGPLFILAHFPDDTGVSSNEMMLGFAATDLEACVRRVEEAGGAVLDYPKALPEGVPPHAFVKDPEGHVVQLSQRMG
ncbi:Glyoxalase/bleomycin resistance protein/dioxygenase [Sphingobium herbicidovorans NBRC 16415]|uniref:Glyoxalase/bleomycin resistance protein/dioxygenase n=2 Tax=Sphingobium herbicidovorans TaxID=76947 RepID=A0A086P676_SPHHM|nr:VOC family protein [Sphingobium herbicidovorans]KFG88894.1 Glyoxalase/bleomycin resistance protein/dioxygenase [Sphingobium herbicidovorans NBRC 16415]